VADSYLVQLGLDAERQRSSFSATHLLELERILIFLSIRPYPRSGSQLVSARDDMPRSFRYAQRGLGFSVEYRVYEPDSNGRGLVVITALLLDETAA
jgi:hypothetical protein